MGHHFLDRDGPTAAEAPPPPAGSSVIIRIMLPKIPRLSSGDRAPGRRNPSLRASSMARHQFVRTTGYPWAPMNTEVNARGQAGSLAAQGQPAPTPGPKPD